MKRLTRIRIKPFSAVQGRLDRGAIEIIPLILIAIITVTTLAVVDRIQKQNQELRTRAVETCEERLTQLACVDLAGCRWESFQQVNSCSGSPPCQSSQCTISNTTASCNPAWIDLECTSHSGCTFPQLSCDAFDANQAECISHGGCQQEFQACAFVNGICPAGCIYSVAQPAFCSGFAGCNLFTDEFECEFEGCTWNPARAATCTGTRYTGCSGLYDGLCSGTYVTGQVCTGTYTTTAFHCVGTPIIPSPSPSPSIAPSPSAGLGCDNAGGRCWLNSYVCVPNILVSPNDCGTGKKCVTETAVCNLPSPSPSPSPSPFTCVANGNYCVSTSILCDPGDIQSTTGGTCPPAQVCCIPAPPPPPPPPPPPSPGTGCNNAAGKCVPTGNTCTPSTLVSPNDCSQTPVAQKCVQETAVCTSCQAVNATCTTAGSQSNCCTGNTCVALPGGNFCQAVICAPNTKRCATLPTRVETCNISGTAWTTFQTCLTGQACSVSTFTCVAPPVVTLKANETDGSVTITYGTTATLSWTTTNAPTTCTASGAWTGAKSTTGASQSTLALTTAQTYTLTCTNVAGSGSDTVTVNVTTQPVGTQCDFAGGRCESTTLACTPSTLVSPNDCGTGKKCVIETATCALAPVVTLRANETDGSIAIQYGTQATLSWSATNTPTSCTASASPTDIFWTGTKSTTGSQSTSVLTSSKTYTLSCTNTGGTGTDSVFVSVLPAGVGANCDLAGGKCVPSGHTCTPNTTVSPNDCGTVFGVAYKCMADNSVCNGPSSSPSPVLVYVCNETLGTCSSTTTPAAGALKFSTLPLCQAECFKASPTPTPSPLTSCEENGGKCVETNSTCVQNVFQSALYSFYSCAGGRKCVAEGASCTSCANSCGDGTCCTSAGESSFTCSQDCQAVAPPPPAPVANARRCSLDNNQILLNRPGDPVENVVEDCLAKNQVCVPDAAGAIACVDPQVISLDPNFQVSEGYYCDYQDNSVRLQSTTNLFSDLLSRFGLGEQAYEKCQIGEYCQELGDFVGCMPLDDTTLTLLDIYRGGSCQNDKTVIAYPNAPAAEQTVVCDQGFVCIESTDATGSYARCAYSSTEVARVNQQQASFDAEQLAAKMVCVAADGKIYTDGQIPDEPVPLGPNTDFAQGAAIQQCQCTKNDDGSVYLVDGNPDCKFTNILTTLHGKAGETCRPDPDPTTKCDFGLECTGGICIPDICGGVGEHPCNTSWCEPGLSTVYDDKDRENICVKTIRTASGPGAQSNTFECLNDKVLKQTTTVPHGTGTSDTFITCEWHCDLFADVCAGPTAEEAQIYHDTVIQSAIIRATADCPAKLAVDPDACSPDSIYQAAVTNLHPEELSPTIKNIFNNTTQYSLDDSVYQGLINNKLDEALADLGYPVVDEACIMSPDASTGRLTLADGTFTTCTTSEIVSILEADARASVDGMLAIGSLNPNGVDAFNVSSEALAQIGAMSPLETDLLLWQMTYTIWSDPAKSVWEKITGTLALPLATAAVNISADIGSFFGTATETFNALICGSDVFGSELGDQYSPCYQQNQVSETLNRCGLHGWERTLTTQEQACLTAESVVVKANIDALQQERVTNAALQVANAALAISTGGTTAAIAKSIGALAEVSTAVNAARLAGEIVADLSLADQFTQLTVSDQETRADVYELFSQSTSATAEEHAVWTDLAADARVEADAAYTTTSIVNYVSTVAVNIGFEAITPLGRVLMGESQLGKILFEDWTLLFSPRVNDVFGTEFLAGNGITWTAAADGIGDADPFSVVPAGSGVGVSQYLSDETYNYSEITSADFLNSADTDLYPQGTLITVIPPDGSAPRVLKSEGGGSWTEFLANTIVIIDPGLESTSFAAGQAGLLTDGINGQGIIIDGSTSVAVAGDTIVQPEQINTGILEIINPEETPIIGPAEVIIQSPEIHKPGSLVVQTDLDGGQEFFEVNSQGELLPLTVLHLDPDEAVGFTTGGTLNPEQITALAENIVTPQEVLAQATQGPVAPIGVVSRVSATVEQTAANVYEIAKALPCIGLGPVRVAYAQDGSDPCASALQAAGEVISELFVGPPKETAITIGRPTDITALKPDMSVNIDGVSRGHLTTGINSSGEIYILDNGSTNGTRVNGEVIPANQAVIVNPGETVELGAPGFSLALNVADKGQMKLAQIINFTEGRQFPITINSNEQLISIKTPDGTPYLLVVDPGSNFQDQVTLYVSSAESKTKVIITSPSQDIQIGNVKITAIIAQDQKKVILYPQQLVDDAALPIPAPKSVSDVVDIGDVTIVVGRGPNNLGSEAFALKITDEPAVSRNQAAFFKQGDSWYIADGYKGAPSTNGTYVNGNKIGLDPVKINNGDKVYFGLDSRLPDGYRLQYELQIKDDGSINLIGINATATQPVIDLTAPVRAKAVTGSKPWQIKNSGEIPVPMGPGVRQFLESQPLVDLHSYYAGLTDQSPTNLPYQDISVALILDGEIDGSWANLRTFAGDGREGDFFFLDLVQRIRDGTVNLTDDIDPVVVYKLGEVYVAKGGTHRIAATKAAGVETIQGKIIELPPKQRFEPWKFTSDPEAARAAYLEAQAIADSIKKSSAANQGPVAQVLDAVGKAVQDVENRAEGAIGCDLVNLLVHPAYATKSLILAPCSITVRGVVKSIGNNIQDMADNFMTIISSPSMKGDISPDIRPPAVQTIVDVQLNRLAREPLVPAGDLLHQEGYSTEARDIKPYEMYVDPGDEIISLTSDDVITNELARVGDKPLRVLDVGAGNGGMLLHTQAIFGENVRLSGISGQDYRSPVNPLTGIDYRVGNAENILEIYEPQSFDLIISKTTAIHFVDPWGTITRLYELLAPDGLLVMDGIKLQGLSRQDINSLVKYMRDQGYDIEIEIGGIFTLRKITPRLELPIQYDGLLQTDPLKVKYRLDLPELNQITPALTVQSLSLPYRIRAFFQSVVPQSWQERLPLMFGTSIIEPPSELVESITLVSKLLLFNDSPDPQGIADALVQSAEDTKLIPVIGSGLGSWLNNGANFFQTVSAVKGKFEDAIINFLDGDKLEHAAQVNATFDDSELLYSTNVGIRAYSLHRGESTEELLRGTIQQAAQTVRDEAVHQGIIDKYDSQTIAQMLAPKIVAEITAQHMSSGLSIPRVVAGGEYELADTIRAASCVDACVFNKEVLERGFGISSEIRKTRLGIVPNHHYLLVETGNVIDPIIASKSTPGGFFRTMERFQQRLNAVNSGGVTVLVKQVKNLFNPKSKIVPEPKPETQSTEQFISEHVTEPVAKALENFVKYCDLGAVKSNPQNEFL